MNRQKIIKKLINRDYVKFEQELGSYDKNPVVYHKNNVQITFVKEGNGLGMVDGKIFQLTKGDMVFIKKNQNHSFKAKNFLDLEHYYFSDDDKNNILNDRVFVAEKFDF